MSLSKYQKVHVKVPGHDYYKEAVYAAHKMKSPAHGFHPTDMYCFIMPDSFGVGINRLIVYGNLTIEKDKSNTFVTYNTHKRPMSSFNEFDKEFTKYYSLLKQKNLMNDDPLM